MEYFAGADLYGEVQHVEKIETMETSWFGDFVEDMDARQFSVRLSTDLAVPEPGRYLLGLSCTGQGRLWVDDELLIDNWVKDPLDFSEKQAEIDLQAGQSYRLVVGTVGRRRATGGACIWAFCPRLRLI